MTTRRTDDAPPKSRRRPPASTPQARENEMIALAVDAAERMMQGDNPPAQIVTHYLKLGSSTEKLNQMKTEAELELMQKKVEIMDAHERIEALYSGAIEAMRSYRGEDPNDHGGRGDEY